MTPFSKLIIFIAICMTVLLGVVVMEQGYKDKQKWDGMIELDLNNSWDFTVSGNINKSYGIMFSNLTIQGRTPSQKRAYLFGYLMGVINQYGNNENFTIIIENQSKTFTINNFPLEDDCISENKCWVKYE